MIATSHSFGGAATFAVWVCSITKGKAYRADLRFGSKPAVQLWPFGGHGGLPDSTGQRRGVVVDENVRADLDGVDPLGARPQSDARHAVPVGLLLEPTGVGHDHPRLRGQRDEVDIAERRRGDDCPVQAETVSRQRSRSPRMDREDDGLGEAVQALDDPRQPVGPRVGLPVHSRGEIVPASDPARPECANGDARSARGVWSRRPSRRRRPRFVRRPAHVRAYAAIARPERTGRSKCGRPRSGFAPRASRGRRSAVPPPRGRSVPAHRPRRGHRRASSSCLHRRALRPVESVEPRPRRAAP